MIPAVGKVNVNHSFHAYPCEVKCDWMRIRTKMASGFSFTLAGASHELTCRNLAPKGRFAKQFNMQETKTNEHSLTFTTAFGTSSWQLKDVQCACPMCTSKSVRKHHRSSRVGAIGFATHIGIVQLICRPDIPRTDLEDYPKSGCTCFHSVIFSMVFDVCLI